MSKYGGHNKPYTSIEKLTKGCYGLYKASHEDEYENEKGEESAINEFMRESGKIGVYLAKSFYDIVIKGK